MIEVEMSKDIREVEPRVIGPLSVRKFLAIIVATAYGIPIFLLLKGMDIFPRTIITFVCMMPALLAGFVKVYGMNLASFFVKYILGAFTKPQKRPYISNEFVIEDEPQSKKRKVNTKTHKGRG